MSMRNTDWENIELSLQLHERIEIIYVVDGYQVQFYTQDGSELVYEVHGETLQQAMEKLAREKLNHRFDRKKYWENKTK